MGFAATQIRLLQLTSRQHRIEYKAQKIQAQKLQLSNESDMVYNAYVNALDAKKIQYKFIEDDGSITYNDANFNNMFSAYGAGVQTQYGLQYLNGPNAGCMIVTQDVVNAYNGGVGTPEDFATTMMNPRTDEAEQKYYVNLFNLIKNIGGCIAMSTTDTRATSTEWLTNMIANGDVIMHKWDIEGGDDAKGEWMEVSLSTDTLLQEVADEKNLKKAEALYEAENTKINNKDAQYDTLLSQTETERNAIKTEMDSLKQVRNDNIEKAFKCFS